MYNRNSYLRGYLSGLDNGNRRCEIRIGNMKVKIIISLISGIIIGSAITLEVVSLHVY